MTNVSIGDVLPAVVQKVPVKSQVEQLVTGRWFHAVLAAYLRARAGTPAIKQHAGELAPAQAAERLIRRASVEAGMLGSGAAAITTGAGAWTAQTNGVAALWTVPIAGAAMLGDMLARAFITLRLSCEVAELFDVHFDADNPADLSLLHAVAARTIEPPQDADERGHALLESLSKLDPEEVSRAVGLSSVNETLLRDVVPVVGLFTSSVASYRFTQRLGRAAVRYAHARAAFRRAFAPIIEHAPQQIDLLIEGVWFILTAEGQLQPEDVAIMSHLLHARPEDLRQAVLERLRDDEASWLERLGGVPPDLHQAFYDALCVAATIDTEVSASKRRLLAHAAAVLAVPAREQTLDAFADDYHRTAAGNPAAA